MIYLIMKIFLYLLLAMAAGGGAGWLLRNISAMKKEEALNRALSEARARVPQFEAQLRAREDQGKRTRDEMTTKERVIAELMEEIKAKEDTLREKELALKKLATIRVPDSVTDLTDTPLPPRAADDLTDGDMLSADNLDYAAVSGELDTVSTTSASTSSGSAGPDDQAETESRLRDRISVLEHALDEARATAADAVAEAAAAEAEVVTLKAELAKVSAAAKSAAASAGTDQAGHSSPIGGAGSTSTSDLEARLRQKAEDFERLNRTLETEKRKVIELERERELQNRSLQVLHQQLELERERGQRAANG